LAKSENFAASFRFRSILLNRSIISAPHTQPPPNYAGLGRKRDQLMGPVPTHPGSQLNSKRPFPGSEMLQCARILESCCLQDTVVIAAADRVVGLSDRPALVSVIAMS
jgi:hypothetical protein